MKLGIRFLGPPCIRDLRRVSGGQFLVVAARCVVYGRRSARLRVGCSSAVPLPPPPIVSPDTWSPSQSGRRTPAVPPGPGMRSSGHAPFRDTSTGALTLIGRPAAVGVSVCCCPNGHTVRADNLQASHASCKVRHCFFPLISFSGPEQSWKMKILKLH